MSDSATPAPSPVRGEPNPTLPELREQILNATLAKARDEVASSDRFYMGVERSELCVFEVASILSDRERMTRRIAELEADGKRLDWLERAGGYVSRHNGEFEGMNPHWETHIEHENGEYYGASARAAIDAARASLPSDPDHE